MPCERPECPIGVVRYHSLDEIWARCGLSTHSHNEICYIWLTSGRNVIWLSEIHHLWPADIALPSGSASRQGSEPSCRERSILSRSDLIQLEGVVARVLGGGSMEIECNNRLVVRAVLSGRMKKHRIKVMVGDRVQVSVSPYDTSHGLITYRF